MKKILLLLVILQSASFDFSRIYPAEKARGVFIALGVGPRLPIGNFASTSDLGYGFNIELSYTDTDYLPFFLFAKAGYETYPGSQSFYQGSDHSNFSTNSLPVTGGARYYFPPLWENIVLLIPVIEAGVSFSYYQKLHQFKSTAGKANFTEENSKVGLFVGGGFSMFMMEVLASYSYFTTNQFISIDFKVRLPLYINL